MKISLVVLFALLVGCVIVIPAMGFVPYSRSLWDSMFPMEDPFQILEQTPVAVPKAIDTLNLARADWKETPLAHVITIDVPGVKKEDIKIEVEENRVLRVGGERRTEEEVEGEKWHRAERTSGKFWRQFRLPANSNMEGVRAHLENGVLRVTVPKLGEDRKRQPRLINIVEYETNKNGEDIKASRAEM